MEKLDTFKDTVMPDHINALIDENTKLREAVRMIAHQLDYVNWGHNHGITHEVEHYIEISASINSILGED